MSRFTTEGWIQYGVAVGIMTVRFITRWRIVGWRKFDGTDFWCVVAAVST